MLYYMKSRSVSATNYTNYFLQCILLLGVVFCSAIWSLVEYKLLFPVVFLCCISSICYYIGYDFYGVFFIRLSLLSVAMFNVRGIAGCVGYHLVWGIFCGVLLAGFGAAGCCGRGRGISGRLWFFCGIAPCGGGSISIFDEFFASIDKISILGAGLGAGIQFYGVLRSSCYFLIS